MPEFTAAKVPGPNLLVVMGTRPEVIKLFPVIRALRRRGARARLCVTAQHRGLLDGMLREFGLKADFDLDLMRSGQRPSELLPKVIAGVDKVLASGRPDLVLVQGDTTSAFGACLAAFYRGISVGHVEAGLRTHDFSDPFPEEANRVFVDRLSTLLFAPTALARANLLREGIPARKILVTGNTGVDALEWALERAPKIPTPGFGAGPLAVMTLHRQENFGAPLERIFAGVRRAAELCPELTWVFPVHPNPRVRAAARRLRHPRVRLTAPLGHSQFGALLKRAAFILTDSGGIQEEAPTLGKPVLVAREKTERPELLKGWGVLVGSSTEKIAREAVRLVRRPPKPPRGPNPFGDGRAGERIAAAVLERF
mgnify:CR=1 FL=1